MYLTIKKKSTRDTKRQNTQKRQVINIRPDRAGMLELSDQEFRTIMINMPKVQKNMLKALTEKSNSMQEGISNISTTT